MTTKTYGKNELVGLLTPLVLPLIRDRAVIGNPIPGNNANAGVSIGYEKYSVVLTTDQYETLRLEVLQYIQARIEMMTMSSPDEVTSLIKDRLNTVFADA